jgi:tRNA U34 5-carboxymethylaminomethyl modifying enzyme MnmG/GidA
MTEKNIQKEAYEQAERELLQAKVEEAKKYVLETLNRIELKKEERSKIEEELRVLKLDLEDLRNGNFHKVKERQEKSDVAKRVGVPIRYNFVITTARNSDWFDWTGGTYRLLNGKNIYF